MVFGIFGKDDAPKKTKKAQIQERNKRHHLINLLAWQQESQSLQNQEDSGIYLDTNDIGAETEEDKRKRLEARLAAGKARLSKGRDQAMKKWSVANTSSGAFHVR